MIHDSTTIPTHVPVGHCRPPVRHSFFPGETGVGVHLRRCSTTAWLGKSLPNIVGRNRPDTVVLWPAQERCTGMIQQFIDRSGRYPEADGEGPILSVRELNDVIQLAPKYERRDSILENLEARGSAATSLNIKSPTRARRRAAAVGRRIVSSTSPSLPRTSSSSSSSALTRATSAYPATDQVPPDRARPSPPGRCSGCSRPRKQLGTTPGTTRWSRHRTAGDCRSSAATRARDTSPRSHAPTQTMA